MLDKIRGTRSRPRVGILGEPDENIQAYFNALFPTIWIADDIYKLMKLVDYREVDLLIVLDNFDYSVYQAEDIRNYLDNAHIICFSDHLILPGPLGSSEILAHNEAETEEYIFTDVPLPMNRLRAREFINVEGIRGYNVITSTIEPDPHDHRERVKREYQFYIDTMERLKSSALVIERATQFPLAVNYLRESNSLHVGFLPNSSFGYEWVEILCQQWAESDRERFPNFGNWQKSPDWMTKQEINLAVEIEQLETQRYEVNRAIDLQIAEINQSQIALAISVNQHSRRLITAQGRELVDEVAAVFREMGFGVQIYDDEIEPDAAKREDLRLSIPENASWEAIVEVRGYARATGQTQDFQRLGRFAILYMKEKGKLPDKRILVVNGEIEISQPSSRQLPFSAAKDDLGAFSDDDGVVIWSLDLFRQAKQIGEVPAEEMRKSISEAKGRWRGLEVN